jgi:hypothetical protein
MIVFWKKRHLLAQMIYAGSDTPPSAVTFPDNG